MKRHRKERNKKRKEHLASSEHVRGSICLSDLKTPWYRRWYFWLILGIVLLLIIAIPVSFHFVTSGKDVETSVGTEVLVRADDLTPVTLFPGETYTDHCIVSEGLLQSSTYFCSSEDASVASISCDTFDSAQYLYYTITGDAVGQTRVFLHLQEKSGVIHTIAISVCVTADDTNVKSEGVLESTTATTSEFSSEEDSMGALSDTQASLPQGSEEGVSDGFISNDAENDAELDEFQTEGTQGASDAVVLEPKDGVVYITPSGEKYHFSRSCAGKNAIETTLDAVQGIREPCKKCVK